MDQKPSIGRIVHYVSYGTPNGEYKSECRAAVVTAIYPETFNDDLGRIEVDLCVLNPQGMFFNQRVVMGDAGGQWHWPERV